jgi:hypothetical protein
MAEINALACISAAVITTVGYDRCQTVTYD